MSDWLNEWVLSTLYNKNNNQYRYKDTMVQGYKGTKGHRKENGKGKEGKREQKCYSVIMK